MFVEFFFAILFHLTGIGHTEQFERESDILRTLDTLETRLQEQDDRLELQETLLKQYDTRLELQNKILEKQNATLKQQEELL